MERRLAILTRGHDGRHRGQSGRAGTFYRWASFLLVVALVLGFSGLHRLARMPQRRPGPAAGVGLRLCDVTGGEAEAWNLLSPLQQTSRNTWEPPALVHVRSVPVETVPVPAAVLFVSLPGLFRAPPAVLPFL
jgi:hypothetical protein